MRRLAAAAAVLGASVMLAGCGFTVHGGDPAPTCGAENAASDSVLSAIDPEGIACIVEGHRARFDMSAGTIEKESLGLAADEYAPDVHSTDGPIRLEIVAPHGTVVASTDRIRFFTTDTAPDVDRITYFLVADTEKQLFALLREGADDYGIDRDSVERWVDSVSDEPDTVSDFAFDPGTTVGLNVSYDVRYDASASKQVVIVEVYPL